MEMPESDHTVTFESFDNLASYWLKPQSPLKWDCVFVLPAWLEVWWREFGTIAHLYLCAIRQRETIIGIAPLLLKDEEACFIGSADVCDCLDFVIAPGSEHDFFNILLEDLIQKGIRRLSLRPLRPDSTVLTHLVGIAEEHGHKVSCKVDDVSLELDLPHTWEEYLGILNQKQRHEVRRKLRRLKETGEVSYRIIEDSEAVPAAIDLFLKFFRESRQDKEIFMTTNRESFFRSLAKAMAHAHLLRIGILELDTKPVAAVMCFDYNDTIYLYNNGYDPQYRSLSVGQISKILCIKDSIETGRGKFDFLKGAEEYKYRLGGKEVSLQGCQIVLK
jgi:CelD/BcsL family acetyltransferase involved in cellulose biosynthesis